MGVWVLRRITLRIFAPVLWIGAVSVAAGAIPEVGHRDEPPPGFSGGFGEQSCDACHFSYDLNDPAGELRISGVPPLYIPGERYPITLTLTRPGMALGGIQLAARYADSGLQAGALAPGEGEEERLSVARSFQIEYAQHLGAGTGLAAPDTAQWTILWTAPIETLEGGGVVRFHASGNAANDDDSQFGDFIYTTAAEAAPEPEASPEDPLPN